MFSRFLSQSEQSRNRWFLAGGLSPAGCLTLMVGMALCLLFWFKSQAIDFEPHNRYVDHLYQLQQVEAGINQQVVLLHSGLRTEDGSIGNDSIARDVAELKRLQAELLSIPAFIGSREQANLRLLLQDHIQMGQQKEQLIQQFRQHNAQLRAAFISFPMSVNQWIENPDLNPTLAKELNRLLQNILLIQWTRAEDLTPQLDQQIQQLEGFADRPDLQDVLAQARLILAEHRQVDQFVNQLLSSPGGDRSEALTQAYNRAYRQALNSANAYHRGLDLLLFLLLVGAATLIILKLRAAAAALRRSEAKLRNIFENSQVGIFRTRLEDGLVLDVNQYFTSLMGYDSPTEVIGQKYSVDLYANPGDRQRMKEIVRRTHELRNFKTQFRRRDGSFIWVLFSGQGNVNEGYLEGVISDITELQKAEEALRLSEAKFRAIFENAALGIAIATVEGENLQVNPSVLKLLGYSQEELRRIKFTEYTYLDDLEIDLECYRQLLAGQRDSYRIEKRYIRKDGQLVWVGLTVAAFRDAQGEIQFIITTTEDISDRKQTEADLQASEAELRGLFAAMAEVILVYNREGRCLKLVSTNPDLLIKPSEEQVDRTLYECFPQEQAKIYHGYILQALETRCPLTVEYSLVLAGRLLWFSASVSPLSAETVLWVARDITGLKQVEAALRQSQDTNRALISAIPDLLIRMQADGTYLDIIHGDTFKVFSAERLSIGTTVYDVLPTNHAQERMHYLRQALQTGELQVYEQQMVINGEPSDEEVRIIKIRENEVLVMVRNITERKRFEAELRSQQAFLRQVLDVVPSSIFVKDPEGRFLAVNQASATLYGTTVEEMLGKCDRDFNPDPAQASTFLDTNREVIATLQPKIIQAEAISSMQGESRWFQTIINPFVDVHGQVKGVIGLTTDITLLKQSEAELRQAKEAAEAANRAKSTFLAHMSHELRTPLNIILGFTQLLVQDGSLNPRQQEYLEAISRSSDHLLTLINDVLEISKIEAGKMTLHVSDFNLHTLLDRLRQMFQLKAQFKGLVLTVERSLNLPCYIRTDESKLRQVLVNLLGNAIKFTDTGSVVLRVSQATEQLGSQNPSADCPSSSCPSSNLHTLIFEVADTGLGIAAEELDRLFQPFVQTKTGEQSQQGTGLGLAISQKFVQLMGGEISVGTGLGQGTTFRFSIPVEGLELLQVTSEPRQVIGLQAGQPEYRILVAEDHLKNRQLLVTLLSSVGFAVQEAANGQAAIDRCQHWLPHLIWMDLRMPIMDGFEATQRIKSASGQHPAPVIIALTGSAFEKDRQLALSTGCDDFVRKPLQAEIIFDKMAEYLGVQYLYAPSQSDTVPVPPAPPAPIDRQAQTLQVLATMPSLWLEQLHQAATRVNAKQVLDLVEQIPPAHAALADALSQLVNEFCFEEILELLESCSSPHPDEAG
ncbi:MAG TPA: PAS domain S-box protein [Coleofasciculaceae cyanobacterium]